MTEVKWSKGQRVKGVEQTRVEFLPGGVDLGSSENSGADSELFTLRLFDSSTLYSGCSQSYSGSMVMEQ